MLIFQTPSERQSPAMRRSSLPTAGAGDSNANALSRLSTRPRWLGGEFFGGQLLGTCLHRAHEERRNKDHTKTSRDTPAARSVTATISCARRLLPHGPSGAPLTVAADAAKRGASAARIGTGATIRFDAWPTSLVCCCAVCGLSPCYHSQHGLNSGAVYRLVTIRRAVSIRSSSTRWACQRWDLAQRVLVKRLRDTRGELGRAGRWGRIVSSCASAPAASKSLGRLDL